MGDSRAHKARPLGTCLDGDSAIQHLSGLQIDEDNTHQDQANPAAGQGQSFSPQNVIHRQGRSREEGLVRVSGGMCNKCNSEIIVHKQGAEVDEFLANCSYDKSAETGFSNDMAKCVKVILKCQCCKRLSLVRRYKGTDVLDKTCIILRYTKHTAAERRIREAHRQQPATNAAPDDQRRSILLLEYLRTNSMTEDLSKHYLGMIPVFVTNPDKPKDDNKVHVGMRLAIIRDERKMIRYYVIKVDRHSPAHNMEFQREDELLLVNDQLLVGMDQDKCLTYFSNIHINQEFIMHTRRITNRRSVLDVNFPEDIIYEYWVIRATITVDAFEAAVIGGSLEISKREFAVGQLEVVGKEEVRGIRKVRIKARNDKFLKRESDGSLAVGPCHSSADTDNKYVFEFLTYDARLWSASGRPPTVEICLIRHSLEGSKSFLYINKNDEVVLKEATQPKYQQPGKRTLNENATNTDYDVMRTVFIGHTRNCVNYYLKCYVTGKDHYLACGTDRPVLKQIDDEHREYHDDILVWQVDDVPT